MRIPVVKLKEDEKCSDCGHQPMSGELVKFINGLSCGFVCEGCGEDYAEYTHCAVANVEGAPLTFWFKGEMGKVSR